MEIKTLKQTKITQPSPLTSLFIKTPIVNTGFSGKKTVSTLINKTDQQK